MIGLQFAHATYILSDTHQIARNCSHVAGPVIKCCLSDVIYGIPIFLFIDWLKVRHVIKNNLTIL